MADRPTVPSSLDTKPAAVEIAPAPGNGQMVSAARLEVVTYGQQPQQPQPSSAGGFPVLPLAGIALAIAVIAAPSILAEMNNSKVETLQAELSIAERRLARAESAELELSRIRECIGQ